MKRPQQLPLGFNHSLYDELRSLCKVDLHRHLTGSVKADKLYDIARCYQIDLPGIKDRYDEDYIEQRIIRRAPAESLEEFIRSGWRIVNRIIADRGPEVIPLMAREAIEDANEDNVKYLELRVTLYGRELPIPPPLVPYQKIRRVDFGVMDFLEALMHSIKFRYRTSMGVMTKVILSLPRHTVGRLPERERNIYYDILLDIATDYKSKGVVGFDLTGKESVKQAGIEKFYPPRYFRDFFARAKEAGFQVTIHAGETDSAQSIKEAVELLHADRIGHGIMACQDPEVLDYLIREKIPLEICPTSNVMTGAVACLAEQPIRRFFDSGIVVTVNTDDPVICNTCLTDEYYKLVTELSFTVEDIKKMIANSIEAAFMSDMEKKAAKASFDSSTPQSD